MLRICAVHLAANYGGRLRLPKKAENPFKMGHDQELDTRPELEPDAASHYLTIINPKMDDQARENQHNNQGVIIVMPCSTSQRGTFRCSSACHDLCWSEL